MAVFYAVKSREVPQAQLDALARGVRRQGYNQITFVEAASWQLAFGERAGGNGSYAAYSVGAAQIHCIGSFVYRGAFGANALPDMLDDFLANSVSWDAVWGSYAIVIVADSHATLFTDSTGTLHLYANSQRTLISSSFLALAEALPRLSVNQDSLYDYVFQGAPHGLSTVFDEIALLGADSTYVLKGTAKPHPARPVRLLNPVSDATLDDLAQLCVAKLRPFFSALRRSAGNRVDTALSGGYDSRLLLAMLREQGISAKLHVYGGRQDADVQVAFAIAEGEGLHLDHIDKSEWARVRPEEYPAIVEANYRAFDGYPNDGIFDSGADLGTRNARASNDRLMLNGGGGEILRNFFYLAEGSYSARQVAQSFYCQFDPAVCTPRFNLGDYVGRFASKIAATLGREGHALLSRPEVEAIYPDFRCRYWMGRNNSVNNRLGSAATPYIQADLIRTALTVPLRYKNAGRLQAKMIQLVDPRLAAYQSAYGYSLDRPPPALARLKSAADRRRPPWLRALSYRMKRRHAPSMPWPLAKSYLDPVLGGEFEYMSAFFRLDGVRDAAQFNRICTLEFMFQRLSPTM